MFKGWTDCLNRSLSPEAIVGAMIFKIFGPTAVVIKSAWQMRSITLSVCFALLIPFTPVTVIVSFFRWLIR